MKVQVTFSAETPADIQKLITTLAAFSSGARIESEGVNFDPTKEPDAEPAEETQKRKPKGTKVKTEKTKEAEPAEFDFEEDFSADAAPEKIDLAAIRALVNEKAADHAASIRSIMGSFNVTKLGDLKPAQYDTFYKAINNLK